LLIFRGTLYIAHKQAYERSELRNADLCVAISSVIAEWSSHD